MTLQITRLEERVVFEGSGLNVDDSDQNESNSDVHANDSDSDHDSASAPDNDHIAESEHSDDMTLDNPDGDSSADVSVLVVSSAIADADDLVASVNSDVRIIEIDSTDITLSELLDKIMAELDGEKADNIGFAVHGEDNAFSLASDGDVTLSTLLFSQDQQAFWSEVGSLVKSDGRIDILACGVADNENGQLLVAEIESLTGVNVAASDDNTGNAEYDGDWILETDGVNAEKEYFDSKALQDFDGVLDGNNPALVLSGTITYDEGTEQGDNKALDTGAAASELGDNWDGGNITVVLSGSLDANDTLNWDAGDVGNGAATLTELDGDSVSIRKAGAGKILASISQTGSNTTPLVISFSSVNNGTYEIPDTAEITEILQHIVYSNNSDNPVTGIKTATWTITDADAETSSGTDTTTITVSDANDDPVGVDDTGTASEAGGTANGTAGTDATGNVLTNDTDADNSATKTVSAITGGTVGGATTGTYGTLTLNSDGSYTYVVNNSDATVQALANSTDTITDTFTYTVQDNAGATDTADLVITIQGLNDAPVGVDDTGTASEAGGTANGTAGTDATGNVLTNDTDVDTSDTKTVSAITGGTVGAAKAGSYGSITINSDGSYTYVVDNSNATVQALANSTETITDTFTYTVQDGSGLTDTADLVITIQGLNDAPVGVDDTGTASEAGGTANGTAGTDATGNVLTNDTDVDSSDTKTVSAITGGTVGVAKAGSYGSITINSDGSYTYVVDNTNATVQALANSTDTITDTFTYTVQDSSGLTDTADIVITIQGLNDAPVGVDDTGTATEAGGVSNGTTGSNATGNVLTNDTDVDSSDTKTVSAIIGGTVGVAKTGTYGTLTLNSDGSYTYVIDNSNAAVNALAAGAFLTDTFTYTMKDSNNETSTANLDITISGANENPVAATDSTSISQNQTIQVDVLANDVDADSNDDSSNFTLNSASITTNNHSAGYDAGEVTTPASVSVLTNQVQFNPGDEFNYLGLGETATVVVTYEMQDDSGATSTSTLTLTINGTNDTPVATADTASAVEAGGVSNGTAGTNPSGNVLTNDSDIDHGDTLAVSTITGGTVGGATAGTYGTLTLNSDGSYTYVVDNGNAAVDALATSETLTDTFNYSIEDANGLTSSQTLSVTITGVNDTPVAVVDTQTVAENQTIQINVLANDLDADHNDDPSNFTLNNVSITTNNHSAGYDAGKVSTPASVSMVTNQLQFNPGDEFDYLATAETATVVVTYEMQDNEGATSTSTVTLTITGTNDAPVAAVDTASAVEAGGVSNGTAGTNPSGNVLTNDSDIDHADTFSVSAITGGAVGGAAVGSYGTLNINADGSYTYYVDNNNVAIQALKTGENLTDTFTYTVQDATSDTDTATLTVTISGAYDTPVDIIPSATSVDENSANDTVVGTLSTTDVDSGDTFTYSLLDNAGGRFKISGNEIQVADGSLLDFEAASNHNITVQVTDNGGLTYNEVINITLNNVNDAPTVDAGISNQTGGEDQAFSFIIPADAFADQDMDALTYSATLGNGDPLPAWLSFDSGTRTFSGTPQDLDVGIITVKVTVKDPSLAEVSTTFDIDIQNVNDAPVLDAVQDPTVNRFADVAEDDVTNNGTTVADILGATVSDVDPGAQEGIAIWAVNDSVEGYFEYKIDGGSWTLLDDSVISDTNAVLLYDTARIRLVPNQDYYGNIDDVTAGIAFYAWDQTGGYVDGQIGVDVTTRGGMTAFSTNHGFISGEVTPVNDAPDAVADSSSTDQDSIIVIDVLTNDSDVENDAISITKINGVNVVNDTWVLIGSGAKVMYNSATQTISYDPGTVYRDLDAGDVATDTFNYTIFDGALETTAAVSVNISGLNDVPTLIGISANNVNENSADGTVVANLSTTDIDADDSFTYSIVDDADGRFQVVGNELQVADGSLLDYEADVSHQVTLRTTDSAGAFIDQAFTININDINDAPLVTLSADLDYTEGDGGRYLDSTLTVTEQDTVGGNVKAIDNITVEITSNFEDEQDYFFVDGLEEGSNTYDSITPDIWINSNGNASLTFTSTGVGATLGNFEAILQLIKYQNTSGNPSELARTVTYTVEDIDGVTKVVTQEIKVTAVAEDLSTELEQAVPSSSSVESGADAGGEAAGDAGAAGAAGDAGAQGNALGAAADDGGGDNAGDSGSDNNAGDMAEAASSQANQAIQDLADAVNESSLAAIADAQNILDNDCAQISASVFDNPEINSNEMIKSFQGEFQSLQKQVVSAIAEVNDALAVLQENDASAESVLQDVVDAKSAALKDVTQKLDILNRVVLKAAELLKQDKNMSPAELEKALEQIRTEVAKEVALEGGEAGKIMQDVAEAFISEQKDAGGEGGNGGSAAPSSNGQGQDGANQQGSAGNSDNQSTSNNIDEMFAGVSGMIFASIMSAPTDNSSGKSGRVNRITSWLKKQAVKK